MAYSQDRILDELYDILGDMAQARKIEAIVRREAKKVAAKTGIKNI